MASSSRETDRLVTELQRYDHQLLAWLNRSAGNALLFVDDPVAALRAANLGIGEQTLQELQETMQGIAQKLSA